MKISKPWIHRSLLLLFLLALFGIPILSLLHGIHLERLQIGSFKVEKLYLKLDNRRLRLEAEHIVLPQSKRAVTSSSLPQALERLHLLLRLFDRIKLDRIDFADDRYQILYRDRILYIKNHEYEIAGMVYDRGKYMEVQIPLLRIPRYDSTLSGELRYFYHSGSFEASGFYQVTDFSGNFHLRGGRRRVVFRIDSMRAATLRRLLGLFRMSPEAQEWLGRRLSARTYRLDYLAGEGRIDWRAKRFTPILGSLKAAVELRDARLCFADGLEPIRAEAARVVLRRGNLYFIPRHPFYGRHSIRGSSAALLHLDDPKRLGLLLRLHYKGRLDAGVMTLLKHYGIPSGGLVQKRGNARVQAALDVPLGKGRLRMKGKIVLGPGVVAVGEHSFRLGGGEIALAGRRVVIRHLKIDESWLRGRIDAQFDLQKHRGKGVLFVHRSQVKLAGNVLKIAGLSLPFSVRWDDHSLRLTVPKIGVRFEKDFSGKTRLELADLSRVKAYLKGPLSLLDGGTVSLSYGASGPMDLQGVLLWNDSFFYNSEGVLSRIPFRATIEKGGWSFQALKGKLRYRSAIRTLQLDGLNVDAKRLLNDLSKLGTLSGEGASVPLTVEGRGGVIRYGRYVLLTDRYRLAMKGKDLTFEGTLGKDRVTLKKKGTTLSVRAREIGDRMLHSLIHFNGLQGGRYTLLLDGDTARESYRGEVDIRGGVLKDFKAYNDLIALFNTVPALVSFSNPGFSDKGFELEEGKILFTLKGETLTLTSILLQGKSSTVVGKGTVQLSSGALNIVLGIQTAREVGKALGQLPLVGYILFGKDKSLTVGVRIRGTLQKPEVRTNPLGEVLLYPLEVLRRTLTAPATLAHPKAPSAAPAPASVLSSRPQSEKVPSAPLTKAPPSRSGEGNASKSGQMY